MVWECFIKNKISSLVIIEGIINAKKYIELLEKNLLLFLNKLEEPETYIFQDDNASYHIARLIKVKKRKI